MTINEWNKGNIQRMDATELRLIRDSINNLMGSVRLDTHISRELICILEMVREAEDRNRKVEMAGMRGDA